MVFSCPGNTGLFVVSMSCDYDDDTLKISLCVYIVCNDGELRIVGNESLEVCINNTYGSICDDFWDVQDALVACRQLGFSNG